MAIDPDEPAFPQINPDADALTTGLTVREYFASQIAGRVEVQTSPYITEPDALNKWAIRVWAMTDALLRNA